MEWVLFFDGDCGFCSRSVRWVIRLDRRARIDFAPLQGRLASEKGLVGRTGLDGTVVLWREADGRFFERSDALIELARALGGGWRMFALARFIPRVLRDAVYRWIARHRHQLGGSASCDLPGPELRARLRE